MPVDVTDRIEKSVLLHVSLERAWKALSHAKEFGEWFGVTFDGPFIAGAPLHGKIVPTKADLEVAKLQEPYAGRPFDITVDRIEPPHLFSFRWHPYAVEPGIDYSNEPTTLIVFTLEQRTDGILLTVTESGFDHISLERRAKAFAANEGGWTMQMTLIEKHLARPA
jgi:uncharacterized protein YndB with AHSA1/START domain